MTLKDDNEIQRTSYFAEVTLVGDGRATRYLGIDGALTLDRGRVLFPTRRSCEIAVDLIKAFGRPEGEIANIGLYEIETTTRYVRRLNTITVSAAAA